MIIRYIAEGKRLKFGHGTTHYVPCLMVIRDSRESMEIALERLLLTAPKTRYRDIVTWKVEIDQYGHELSRERVHAH